MPLDEIVGRALYVVFCAWERRQHARGAFSRPDRLRQALLPAYRESADWLAAAGANSSARFRTIFPALSRLPFMRDLFEVRFDHERTEALAEAERVLAGTVRFFGKTFSYPTAVDWHADPLSKRQWPIVYHREVPSSGGNRGYGDIKHVWELNRHQFFMDLAKGHFFTGDERFLSRLQDLHQSWCEQNPYGTGVNWSCALEPAFRVFSWMWSYGLTESALDARARERWLRAFHDHGHFLHRHLEYYTSPYNHLIGEATALFLLGTLFPCFQEAAAWRDRGRGVLESTVDAQFHRDGGTVEQSSFYHHATLGFYLMAWIAAMRDDRPLSDTVGARIVRALEFSMHLQQPDGRVPAIGGADDGKPIRLEHVRWFDFRPYLAMGATLFGRPDFKHAAGRYWEDALWLLGPDTIASFDQTDTARPVAQVALPDSGYVVLRQPLDDARHFVCFDCGPQAAGLRRDAAPSAAHGHADCLSVVLWLGGTPVLVDSGFYCYNGERAWEVYFRKTRAHNTIEIDHTDQAEHVSKMAWCHTYEATLHGWAPGPLGAWASASHDGYRRLGSPATHERTIHLRRLGYAVWIDRIGGRATHDVSIHYHFAPGTATLDHSEQLVGLGEDAELRWFSPIAFDATLAKGEGTAPDSGWVAESLEVALEAPYLRLEGRAVALPYALVTVASARGDGVRVVCRRRDATHTLLAISDGVSTEWLEIRFSGPDGVSVGLWTWNGHAWLGHTLQGEVLDAPAPPDCRDSQGPQPS
jgi:hypothetical protein